MASLIDTALGEALTLSASWVQANEPMLLADLAKANLTVENAVDLFIASWKPGGALSVFSGSIKTALTTAINNAINSGAVTQETAIFNLAIAAAQNEAAVLLGPTTVAAVVAKAA